LLGSKLAATWLGWKHTSASIVVWFMCCTNWQQGTHWRCVWIKKEYTSNPCVQVFFSIIESLSCVGVQSTNSSFYIHVEVA
jgi:hypothetical protein